MKKIMLSIFGLLLIVSLSACGKADIKEKDSNTNTKEIEKNNQVNESEGNIVASDSETTTIKDSGFSALSSDNEKIVFANSDNSKIVFHHNGNKITGYELYYGYEDVVTAEYAKQVIEKEKDETIKKVYLKGSMLVVEYDKSTYEDLTLADVKMVYSYLKEVQK